MKRILFLAVMMSCASLSYAKEKTYTLISGGGVDDTALGLKDSKAQQYDAYCQHKCGDWFEPSEEHDGMTLKPQYKGKKVRAEITLEQNRDRIVGPGDDEMLYFIRKIKLIN